MVSESNIGLAEETVDPTERSIQTTLLEFSGWIAGFVGLVALITLATNPGRDEWLNFDWDSWWFTDVGRSFLADASWLLPTFLAIVLALYAALIGQSVAKTAQKEVWRTRRRLVPAGLAVASLVAVFTLAGTFASIYEPTEWRRMPGISITALAICLLGIGVGKFETQSRDDKIAFARDQRKSFRALRRRLPETPSSVTIRPWVVTGATTLVAVVLPALVLLIALRFEGVPTSSAAALAALGLVVNAFGSLLGIGLPIVLIHSAYAGKRSWKIVKNIGAGACAIFLASFAIVWVITVALDPSESRPSTPEVIILFLPGVLIWVMVEISLFARPQSLPPRLFAWTLHGAVVESIRRNSTARIAALKEEIAGLRRAEAGEREESP
jgi:hypothetical protein